MTKQEFLNFIKDIGFEYNSLHKSFTMDTDEFGDADSSHYIYRKSIKISVFDKFANVGLSEINKLFMSGENLLKIIYENFNEDLKVEFVRSISKHFIDKDKFKSILRNDKLKDILNQ